VSQAGWPRRFDEPIEAGKRTLVTLYEATTYVTGLPPLVANQPHWQAAIRALMLVAETGGPTMMARIGVMRALAHGKPEPTTAPRRKRTKAFRLVR
jgi:hypothetical protein